jgi:nucleoside-diphosphate-sugar epimerase
MRILVAGGAEFIGSYLVERLLLRHDCTELLVVDNFWLRPVAIHLRAMKLAARWIMAEKL